MRRALLVLSILAIALVAYLTAPPRGVYFIPLRVAVLGRSYGR